jgi:hypothetical protein
MHRVGGHGRASRGRGPALLAGRQGKEAGKGGMTSKRVGAGCGLQGSLSYEVGFLGEPADSFGKSYT